MWDKNALPFLLDKAHNTVACEIGCQCTLKARSGRAVTLKALAGLLGSKTKPPEHTEQLMTLLSQAAIQH